MNRTTVRYALGAAAVAAVAMALAVLAVSSLSWTGHGAGAQEPAPLLIKHVNPDGSDFLGNPFCPQTVWSADGRARVISVVA